MFLNTYCCTTPAPALDPGYSPILPPLLLNPGPLLIVYSTAFVYYGVESVPKIEIFYEGEIFRDIPR